MAQVTELHLTGVMGQRHAFVAKDVSIPPFLGDGEAWEAEARPTRWSETRAMTWETDERPREWSYHKHDDP